MTGTKFQIHQPLLGTEGFKVSYNEKTICQEKAAYRNVPNGQCEYRISGASPLIHHRSALTWHNLQVQQGCPVLKMPESTPEAEDAFQEKSH